MAELVKDGNDNFLGGQDFSKDPDKIAPNAYSSGINVTTQDGSLSPRWGWEQQVLDFSNTGNYTLPNLTVRSYKNIFETGKFQAIIPYSVSNVFYLIYIVSGVMFLVNQETLEVTILNINDGSFLGEDADRINWTPASKYLVIYDYPARPVIVQGFLARRSNAALDEVPISNNGVYNQNRLFISNAGNEFTAGDPIGIGFPNAPISFTEVLQPSTGFTDQSFQLSTNYNNDIITAMVFLQAVDSSTGIGPMLVSTQNGIWSYQTQLPRNQWTQGQFGQSFVYNNGIIGPQAVVNVNSDVFYMSNDFQIRAVSMSRDEQATWSKVPISREVRNWLKAWNKDLVKVTHLSYFRNKLFVTSNPYVTDAIARDGGQIYDIAFGGFSVLETDNISNMAVRSSPVWTGLWNGINPMQTAVNDDTFFVAAKHNGKNILVKATLTKTIDIINGEERLVQARVYTRMYDFQSSRDDKNIRAVDMQLNKVAGALDIKIKYRSSLGLNFINYSYFSHVAPYRICDVPKGKELHGLLGHSFKTLNFGNPIDTGCDEVTEDNYTNFRKLQLKIDITGRYWELNQLTLIAMIAPQSEQINTCDEYKSIEVTQECNTDWITTENNLCL